MAKQKVVLVACGTAVATSTVVAHAIEEAMAERGIPVMGHVGLTPQSIRKLGGFRVQRNETELIDDAKAGRIPSDSFGFIDACGVAIADDAASAYERAFACDPQPFCIHETIHCQNIREMIAKQEVSPVEVTEHFLARIEEHVRRNELIAPGGEICCLVSGGFTHFTSKVAARIGFDEDQIRVADISMHLLEAIERGEQEAASALETVQD